MSVITYLKWMIWFMVDGSKIIFYKIKNVFQKTFYVVLDKYNVIMFIIIL